MKEFKNIFETLQSHFSHEQTRTFTALFAPALKGGNANPQIEFCPLCRYKITKKA